ncbi:hypothetical protein JAAARDRAFT_95126, partial [Jaapia argillacea MUCL 33604]
LVANGTGNLTRPDNVFVSSEFLNAFARCYTIPDTRPPNTDHIPIISEVDVSLATDEVQLRRNFRETDWREFRKMLATKLTAVHWLEEIETKEELKHQAQYLESAIVETIEAHIPMAKICPFSKCWWSKHLTAMRREMKKLGRRSYARRQDREDLAHELYRKHRNQY